jgi:hypothetical protein
VKGLILNMALAGASEQKHPSQIPSEDSTGLRGLGLWSLACADLVDDPEGSWSCASRGQAGRRGELTGQRRYRMWAETGDRIVLIGHWVGNRQRQAVILDLEGRQDGPPYVVRWDTAGTTYGPESVIVEYV